MKKAQIGKSNLIGPLAQSLAVVEHKLNNKNAHLLSQVENHAQDHKF